MAEAVTDDIIADLHLRKKAAIEALDFETAKFLYQEIERVKSDRAERQVDDIHYEAVRDVKKVQNEQRTRLEEFVEYRRQADARLYSKYQVLFEEAQDEHIQQLMDLEKERGFSLLEESEKEIPEQVQMLEDAKQQARSGDFDTAIELRQRARVVGEEELERRRQDVEERFVKAKEEMLGHHQEELDEIGKLHEEEINQLRKEAADRDEEGKRSFALAVSLIKHKARVQMEALGAPEEQKRTAFKNLMTEIDESMKEFGELPEIAPKLTKSERMRLTELCPTHAAMNPLITDVSDQETLQRRERVRSALTGKTRTGLRRPPQTSTALISRAFTATHGKR
jgi:hypothetical protein